MKLIRTSGSIADWTKTRTGPYKSKFPRTMALQHTFHLQPQLLQGFVSILSVILRFLGQSGCSPGMGVDTAAVTLSQTAQVAEGARGEHRGGRGTQMSCFVLARLTGYWYLVMCEVIYLKRM